MIGDREGPPKEIPDAEPAPKKIADREGAYQVTFC